MQRTSVLVWLFLVSLEQVYRRATRIDSELALVSCRSDCVLRLSTSVRNRPCVTRMLAHVYLCTCALMFEQPRTRIIKKTMIRFCGQKRRLCSWLQLSTQENVAALFVLKFLLFHSLCLPLMCGSRGGKAKHSPQTVR